MTENKTRQTDASVAAFVKSVADARRRADCAAVIELMRAATKTEPKMWGTSIVGFGSYHYKYDSGREGDMPLVGLSPHKQNLVLYIMPGFEEFKAELKKLGPHSTGKSCLYIKRLDEVDVPTLKAIVTMSIAKMKKKSERD